MFPTGYYFSSGLCFPELFPTGYCFSSGDICDLTRRSNRFLRSFGRHHSLVYRPCLQRCFQLVIASLLDSVFQRCFQLVIASLLEIIVTLLEGQTDFCALLGGTTVSLIDPVSRDVSNWLFLLFWAMFPDMFPTGYFVSSGDNCDLARRSNRFLCFSGKHPLLTAVFSCCPQQQILFSTGSSIYLLVLPVSSPPVLSRGLLKSS